jgi:predicted GNAT family acetyltransferase
VTSAPDIRVTDNPASSRFEVFSDGELAGFAEYRVSDGRIVFTHTEIDDAFEGHGIGSRLIRYALDDARRRGLLVVPKCPFVRRFIEEHEDYADLTKARPNGPTSGIA